MNAIAALAALPVSAALLTALLRLHAGGRLPDQLVAAPSGERWHEHATPSIGGVGIYVGFLAGVGGAVATGTVDSSATLLGIVGGGTILFVAGLVDDVRPMPPLVKLLAQAGAAAVALASGLTVEIVENDAAAVTIGVLWLVGITNAFNLLDNMDGLAATLATIACGSFVVYATRDGGSDTALVAALALGSACLAFLPFNLRPRRRATIFMGDSGSQLIGFTLAAVALALNWRATGATLASVVLPLLVLAVPILDTTFVTLRRLVERRPVTRGGRDHTSHRLVYYGLSETRAVAVLAVIAAALALTGLAYTELNVQQVTTVGVLASFVILVQFASVLGDLEERSRRGAAVSAPSLGMLFFQPRRIAEIVVDFVVVCGCFLAAFLLIAGGTGTPYERAVVLSALPVVLGVRYLAYVAFGIYRRVWRFAGARDALAITTATVAAELVAWLLLLVSGSIGSFPDRVFVVDGLLCTLAVLASRFGLLLLLRASRPRGPAHRVLIVGAGRFGRSLARELREAPGTRVVGFVDDNLEVRGRRVAGVPVVGSLDDVPRLLGELAPDEVLISIPDATAARLGAVVEGCGAHGTRCRVARREIDSIEPAGHAVAP